MNRSQFCVNDKNLGSCWGALSTWDEINNLISLDGVEFKMEGVLTDWNEKRYVFLMDEGTTDNYFIEIED